MSFPSTQGPTLTVRHTGQVFPLGRSPVTIGGQEDNTIVLGDPEVAPLHAIVSWQGGIYTVVDAGSAKGTYLDGRRVRGPRPLPDGSVLRIGNTLFDVRILPAAGASAPVREMRPSAPEPVAGSRGGRPSRGMLIGLFAGGFVVVCLLAAAVFFLLDPSRGGPNVALQSPGQGAQVALGEQIVLKASATGARDITRLELSVDGNVVGSAESVSASGQATLTASQPWVFDRAGPHTVTATAYTAGDRSGKSVTRDVTVVDGSGGSTPSPATPGTETPTATPSPTGTETPTPTPTPTGTPEMLPLPVIEFFLAEPETIDLGQCATLEWGQVSYAVAATINNGIGGVATPGSLEVCPTEATRYVMTASGPGGVSTLEVIVEVDLGQPDLVVDGMAFSPYPPVRGGDTLVEIRIRNAGNAAAGAFGWSWQAGSSSPMLGAVPGGLGAGASETVSLTWRPEGAYTELITVARVDTGNGVAESDETNNELRQTIQVVAPSTTVVLRGVASLDGYVTGGQGAFPEGEIRTGNEGEAVHRGFLSFDLQGVPVGATVESAQLRFYQVNVIGKPYQKLGSLWLTLVDYGSSLDASDFDTLGLGAMSLPRENRPGSWYDVSDATLRGWVEQARSAGRASFQLRLQFEVETDGDGEPDYCQVEAGDNSLGTGNVPELTITYSVP